MRPIVRSLGAAGRVPVHSGAAGHSSSSEQAGNELRLEPGWPAPPCARLCGPEPWLPQFKAPCQPCSRRGLVPGGPGAQEAEQDGGVRVGPGRRAPRGEGRQRIVSRGPSSVSGALSRVRREPGKGAGVVRPRAGVQSWQRCSRKAWAPPSHDLPHLPAAGSHVTQGERERHRGSQRD